MLPLNPRSVRRGKSVLMVADESTDIVCSSAARRDSDVWLRAMVFGSALSGSGPFVTKGTMSQRWFQLPRRRSKSRRRAMGREFPRLRAALGCELLEDRTMLSAVAWIGGATGNWDNAANWSNYAVPGANADVTINTSSPAAIAVRAGDVESIDSLTLGSNDSLSIAGGSLTAAAALSNSGTITVSAGCNLTVNGSYYQAPGATLSMPGGGSTLVPASNLAGNSDFEAPTASQGELAPTQWSPWGTAYVSSQYSYTGSQSLVMSGPSSGVLQSFRITPGMSYTISAEAMTPAANPLTGNEAAEMEVLFFDASGKLLSPYTAPNLVTVLSDSVESGGPYAGSALDQQWNQFNTTAVAPANAVTAQAIVTTFVLNGTGGGAVCWDDVQFGPSAPGPSTFSAGSIVNSGSITVGPTNKIATSGNFTQTSTATLDIQLGGEPTTGENGLVNIGGTATLAGTLKADLVYGYAPTTTDAFTPIEFDNESGSFANYWLPSGSPYVFAGAVTFTNVVISSEPATNPTVTVDANATVKPATTNTLGINLGYWDNQLMTAQTQQMVAAAGLNLYRFPGGSAADDFHFNSSSNNGDSTANTIAQFAQLITSLGGSGMVTLDYGSGSPQEAAAELAYLQGSPNDRTAIGSGLEWNDNSSQWQTVNWGTVGYWASLRGASPLASDDGLNFLRIGHAAPFANINDYEIGNEVYGDWEIDNHGTPTPGGVSTGAAHDPATYVEFAKQFASLAAEIVSAAGLPPISIGIASQDPTGAYDDDWTQNVLADGAAIGFVPGFISDHNYVQAPGSESDSYLLNNSVSDSNSIYDWSTRYNDYESILAQTLGNRASSVSVIATEYYSVYNDPGKQSTSLVNGLYVANSIGSLLESGYSAGLMWDLRDSVAGILPGNDSNLLYGWRENGDYGLLGEETNAAPANGQYIAYPNYFALQLLSKIVVSGGEVVSSTSSYGDLDVYAVKEANGQLEMLVINTNPAAGLMGQVSLPGFQPANSVQVWQYGEAQDTAQSQTADGAASLAHYTTSLNTSGQGFSYWFPAYSMTVLDLSAAAAAPPTMSGPASVSLAGSQQLALSGTQALAVSDLAANGGTIDRVVLSVSAGTLSLNLSGGATIAAGANYSANLTLSGTVAQLNNALGTLIYTAAANVNSATLTAQASDGGKVGAQLSLAISPFVVSGSTLTVYGTGGSDSLNFAAAANNTFTVSINGVSASYSFANIQTIRLIGAGGADITALWLPANCSVSMTPDAATISGPAAQPFTLAVSQSATIVVQDNAASTSSVVQMYGPASGGNTYIATSAYAFLEGAGYTNLEYHFPTAIAFSASTSDAAYLDGPGSGNNTFVGAATYSFLEGAGYTDLAYSFPSVYSTSASATDVAYLYGPGSGANTFIAASRYAFMEGAGYTNVIYACPNVSAIAASASDAAYLYGPTSGSNTFLASSTYAYMQGAGYTNVASGYQHVTGISYSTSDKAYLDGPSSGNNTFLATPTYAYMQGAGYTNVASLFTSVLGLSASAGDTAYLYGASTGGNTFVATPTYAFMLGVGYTNIVGYFPSVSGVARSNMDLAYLYGAATGSNVFVGTASYASLQGAGYSNQATGFNTVIGVSASTSDTATLNASPAADTLQAGTPFTAATDQALIEYPGSVIEVENFPHVIARTTRGVNDPADVVNIGSYNYRLDYQGNWTVAGS